MDFVHATLTNGRTFRILAVVSRHSPLLAAARNQDSGPLRSTMAPNSNPAP